MGVLFLRGDNGIAMLARLEILTVMQAVDDARSVVNTIQFYEPTARYEWDNLSSTWPRTNREVFLGLCKVVSVRVGSARLLFVGGARDATACQVVWEGYLGPFGSFDFSDQVQNLALEKFGEQVSRQAFFSEPRATSQYWCGYSAGGAALHQIWRTPTLNPEDDERPVICTFGAPKPFGNTDQTAHIRYDWYALFADNDPVPLVPPTVGYWQATAAWLSGRQRQRLSRFWMPEPYGAEISVSGNITRRQYPSQVGPDPVGAIGLWMAAAQRGDVTGHSLASYTARARLYAAANVPPPAQYEPDTAYGGTAGGGDYDPPETMTLRVAQEVVDAAQESIIINSPRNLTETSVVLPATSIFKAHRTGRIWWVSFNGTRVVTAPNKKRALGFARVGNDFLRRLQIEGLVDPVALVATLQAYCQDAAAVDGPFQPPMRVQP
jgi:hypothetical protein